MGLDETDLPHLAQVPRPGWPECLHPDVYAPTGDPLFTVHSGPVWCEACEQNKGPA